MSKKTNTDLTFEGVVKTIHKTFYEVEIPDVPAFEGKTVRCTLAGKMRMYKIKVIIGDKVTVVLDSYDPTKGRITYRTK